MRRLPRDLPMMREGMIEFSTTPRSVEMRLIKISDGSLPQGPGTSIEESARTYARAERESLSDAEMYYVDSEMVRLAQSAAASLPRFFFAHEDVPALRGLIYFAEPLLAPTAGSELPIPLSAFLWVSTPKALLLTGFADRDLYVNEEDVNSIGGMFPPMVPVYPSCIIYGDDDGSDISLENIGNRIKGRGDIGEDPEVLAGTKAMLSTLKAVWLLMSQPLADVSDEPVPRAVRKKAIRDGRPPGVLRVIKLRRVSSGESSGDGQVREWQHQWIVKGHWRMQPWGPKRERVRPVWIAPHVKGPEGKPMLGGEKVYHLAR